MRSRFVVAALLALLFHTSYGLVAADLYVDVNAPGADNGTDWPNAYLSLQSALGSAIGGDVIHVAQGTYTPGSNRTDSFTITDGLTLLGGYPTGGGARDPQANQTILSGDIGALGVRGDNSYHVIQGATNATLDGFMVTAGYASGATDNTGAGLLILSTGAMTLSNCHFVENTAYDGSGGFGGAIYANGMTGTLTLTDCVFTRNTSWNTGGAIYMYGSAELVVDRCVFAGNAPLQAPFSGGGAIRTHDTPSQILSSAFVGNWSNDQGGSLMFVGPYLANVVNCTFVDTTSYSTSDAIFTTGGSLTVRNSILWNGNNEIANGGSALTIENNIISNGYAGNSSANPLFINGISSAWTSIGGYNSATATTEIFDTSAFWKTNEFAGMFYRPVGGFGVDAFYIVSNTSGSLTVLGDASGIGLVDYTIMRPILTGSSPAIDAADGTATPRDVRNRTRFDDQNIAGLSAADIGAYERRVHFVNDTASGANDGSNWANAYTDLQDALAVACGDEEIWVAAGAYTPTAGSGRNISFEIGTDVSLYGGFAGTETTNAQRDVRDWRANLTLLSGDLNGDDAGFTNNVENSFNVVRLSNNTLINGFFIRGGNADDAVKNSGGGIVASGISNATIYDCELQYNYADLFGGGIIAYQSSYIDIERLRVIDCEADFGGAVCLLQSSDISIRNGRFSDNEAITDGGGLYLGTASNVEIINTLISDNWAWQTGGGLHFADDSDPYILNCTIAYNAAGVDGDGIRCWDTSDNPWIFNSIIWGNDAPINTNGSSITVNYSNIRGGFSGIGNIDVIPCFVSESTGNYALNTGSPCIDAGDGDESSFLTYDLAGNPRFHDDAGRINDGIGALPYVDMGAYEFQGNTSIPFIWYVDLNATGDNNGSTWTDAFVDLQNALVVTEPGDQIWVAAGDYYPSVPSGREAVFEIPSGIKLYGGFIGTEVSISERVWAVNNTVLNADIGIPFDNTDNTYRLIVSFSATSLYIDGFTIANGFSDGGSLYPPLGAGAFIEDCLNALIVNCRFTDSYAEFGGAFFAYTINLSVSNCEFDNNSSVDYGGAACIVDSVVSFRDTVFDSNQTNSSGGAIYSNNCIFDASSCDFAFNSAWNSDGGAIYLDDAAASFRSSSFSNNYALNSGGAVYQYLGSLSLSDVTLTDNQADNTGGALYLYDLDAVIMDSTFDSCYAVSEGGAIYQLYGSLSATGCDFYSNQTNMNEGGALYLAVVSTDINNSYFYNNYSGFHAGAAYFNSCDVTLKNSAFESNSTSGYGGALYQEGSSISVSTCDFYGNYTDNRPGGALYMTYATSDIADSYFSNNVATDSNGGAIASSDSDITLLRTLFEYNDADYDGGAIDIVSGTLSASGCAFEYNYVYGSGGAINSYFTSSFIQDTTFTENYADGNGG
ncbi:MAG: choice-of-anchor Q domain-containing protein, partial [Planctomycetota bacterium]